MKKILNIVEWGSLIIVIVGLVLRVSVENLSGTIVIIAGVFLRILWYVLVKVNKVDFTKDDKEYREDILDDIDGS